MLVLFGEYELRVSAKVMVVVSKSGWGGGKLMRLAGGSTRFIAAVQNDTYVALSKGQLIKTGDERNPPLVPGGAHLLVSARLGGADTLPDCVVRMHALDHSYSAHPQPSPTTGRRSPAAHRRDGSNQGPNPIDV